MRLITAHRILIGSAIACFAFYAAWELRGFATGSDTWALARALGASTAAVAFGLYYARVLRHWR